MFEHAETVLATEAVVFLLTLEGKLRRKIAICRISMAAKWGE